MHPLVQDTSGDVQTLFRQVNDRVLEVNGILGPTARLADFVCECRDAECSERLTLSVAQFVAVRSHPSRHVVRPGHVEPALERTVEVHKGFAVVEPVRTAPLVESQAAA
ncbi:MAG: hypothetical protein ACM3QU_00640 [Verrucomicrobiota bacterium]